MRHWEQKYIIGLHSIAIKYFFITFFSPANLVQQTKEIQSDLI